MLAQSRAFEHALQLAYRGSPRLEECLDLLMENQHDTLLRSKPKYLRPPYTWAKIAETAVGIIAIDLLHGGVDRAMATVDDARALEERLRARDDHPTARVTSALRHRIGLVSAAVTGIEAADAVLHGSITDDTLTRLSGLHTRWYAARREFASDADVSWVLDLVQRAVARVLSSTVGSAAKAMATRTLSTWLPELVEKPHATAPGLSTATVPGAKRIKLSHGAGEQLVWSDADDDLSL